MLRSVFPSVCIILRSFFFDRARFFSYAKLSALRILSSSKGTWKLEIGRWLLLKPNDFTRCYSLKLKSPLFVNTSWLLLNFLTVAEEFINSAISSVSKYASVYSASVSLHSTMASRIFLGVDSFWTDSTFSPSSTSSSLSNQLFWMILWYCKYSFL